MYVSFKSSQSFWYTGHILPSFQCYCTFLPSSSQFYILKVGPMVLPFTVLSERTPGKRGYREAVRDYYQFKMWPDNLMHFSWAKEECSSEGWKEGSSFSVMVLKPPGLFLFLMIRIQALIWLVEWTLLWNIHRILELDLVVQALHFKDEKN